MSRSLEAAVATGVVAPVVPFALFAEFAFASGTLRMWSGVGAFAWVGETWLGLGDLTGVGTLDETTEIGASSLTFSLSGVPSGLRALALGQGYRGRPCKLWLAILSADLTTVVGSTLIFGGRMDTMPLTAGSDTTSSISIVAENRLVDLRRSRPSRYTDAEQRLLDATDTGLSRIAKLAERPFHWGVAAPARAASPGLDNTSNHLD